MASKNLTKRQPSPSIQKAQTALRTTGGDPAALFDVAEKLVAENQLEIARRVFEKALDQASSTVEGSQLRIKILHKLAVVTYKDPDLPLDDRLKSAEAILD